MIGCAGQAERVSAPDPSQAAAEVYVFNNSGWTLIPSNQEVRANGKLLASLPRRTYTRVRIPPGVHELQLHGRRLVLDAQEGKAYFVVAAYRPERSRTLWSTADPVEIRQISENEARMLMRELTSQGID